MWKKIALTAISAALLCGTLASCGSDSDSMQYTADGKPIISIMTAAYQPESASDDAEVNPVMKYVEDRMGVDLRISWIPSSNYNEKVTATMGAGTYPLIMKVGDRSAAIIANCRGGTFWEVGDKMLDAEKFPNLAKANQEVMHNMSVDGKVYGVYLSRDLGRNGVSIREDWLDAVGLDYPETLADLREVCKRFTENDPDGNGKDDTYGMIITSYTGPIDNITVWAGAPNKYGLNEETNQLEPAFMFPEYLEGINFIKDLYDNGYMNTNFATMDAEKWNEPFLNGQAGVIIDVADRARRLQQNITALNPDAKVGVFGSVARVEGEERRVLPTTGYNGFYVFPKESVKTEEELDMCLKVLDQFEEPDIGMALQYGLEGVNYTIENGVYKHVKKADNPEEDDTTNNIYYADLNQLMTFISGNDMPVEIPYASEVAERVDEVLEENIQYSVPDPSAPYVSNTYSLKGTMLDAIMSEATTKYITGDITEDQWKAEIQRWRDSGGDDVIAELTEQWLADESAQADREAAKTDTE